MSKSLDLTGLSLKASLAYLICNAENRPCLDDLYDQAINRARRAGYDGDREAQMHFALYASRVSHVRSGRSAGTPDQRGDLRAVPLCWRHRQFWL